MEEIEIKYKMIDMYDHVKGLGHTLSSEDSGLQAIEDMYTSLVEEVKSNGGFIYVKYINGFLKDSVGKLHLPDIEFECKGAFYITPKFINDKGSVNFDGVKKPKRNVCVDSPSIVWLKGYVGETIYKTWDTEKAVQDFKTTPIIDINGSELVKGSEVVFYCERLNKLQKGIIKVIEPKIFKRFRNIIPDIKIEYDADLLIVVKQEMIVRSI